ncbi:hypothetical protein SDC9_105312 [bioreactor metagenome]|uniref:Uncharacterized protein n=1 Tax=bioreactor metagenome TaxID=1076179 RepID=A0A645B1N5_9ZZZZ
MINIVLIDIEKKIAKKTEESKNHMDDYRYEKRRQHFFDAKFVPVDLIIRIKHPQKTGNRIQAIVDEGCRHVDFPESGACLPVYNPHNGIKNEYYKVEKQKL